MHISYPSSSKKGLIYKGLVILWILLSIHVGYLYVTYSSDEMISKGGTYIEATDHYINYLPYITTNDNDTFYQSLLFNGCIYPSISGTSITYREELCGISTEDYQTFRVSIQPGHYWSDGSEVDLNDIYFTYNTILKNNYWNLSHLDTYKNIRVEVVGNTLDIIFPTASIDNMIFFTNFILPADVLANKSLETYIDTFLNAPVGSNCASIQPSTNDQTSIVFDLLGCEDTLLRYYQVKQFPSTSEIESYVQNNQDTIDMIFTNSDQPGYTSNSVILNKFVTLFFNIEREYLTPDLRKQIVNAIHDANSEDGELAEYIIPDQYVFDSIEVTSPRLGTGSFSNFNLNEDTNATIQTIPDLPDSITWGSENNQEKEFLLQQEIADKFTIFMKFEDAFDRVSISYNDGIEYFPESFSNTNQSTYYNLNPIYRNIGAGRNVYTIKGYNGNVHEKTYTFVIHYLSEPSYPLQENIDTVPNSQSLTIIYYEDVLHNKVVDHLKSLFRKYGVESYISYEGFTDANAFEGKLSSKDYDIAIRNIDMGLRKDLSALFTSPLPTINPSLYVNEELAEAINTYFLWSNQRRDQAKTTIDEIYNEDVPLYILGKQLGQIQIRDDLNFTYPLRLYVLGRRKDFLNGMSIFQHVSINRDKVFDIKNFFRFLGEYW